MVQIQEPEVLLKDKGIEALLWESKLVISLKNRFIKELNTDTRLVFNNRVMALIVTDFTNGLIEMNNSTDPKGEAVLTYDPKSEGGQIIKAIIDDYNYKVNYLANANK